jgi:hypothetical protein
MTGMAEDGTIGASATIANAVADALAPAGVDPGAITFYPLTAPHLFAVLAAVGALRGARRSSGDAGRSAGPAR